MTDSEQRFLTFHSAALAEGDLLVTGFSGEETLGRPYRFEIELISHKNDIDMRALLEEPAWLGIKQAIQLSGSAKGLYTRKIHGILDSFEQCGESNDLTKYKAVLVPSMTRLARTRQSRVFQDASIEDLIREVLAGHDIEGDAFEIRQANRNYPVRDYIVQYEESDLAFLSRWLEHEGLFYYFEQTDESERIVFADSSAACPAISEEIGIPYRPQLGDDGSRSETEGAGDSEEQDWYKSEVLQSLQGQHRTVPTEIVLNEYDWRRPQQNLQVTAETSKIENAETDSVTSGFTYEYHSNYRDPETEGKDLGRIRCEERLTEEFTLKGSSDCRSFRPGHKFAVTDHPRADWNEAFTLITVNQRGTQDIGLAGSGAIGATYDNEFTAIPASRTYRTPRTTPWPVITGVMYGHVDGPAASTTPQIDYLGRYKVKLPIDLSDPEDGKASRYVRMAQPFSGAKYGMHFPLHVGTEVILAHVDGDPDRPLIIGSLPNPDTKSPVTSENSQNSIIRTVSGCMIEFKDA